MKREQVLALYDTYADSVYRVALGYLRSPHDAEDAVQEAWLRLSRTGGDGVDNLSAWLTTVTSRVCPFVVTL